MLPKSFNTNRSFLMRVGLLFGAFIVVVLAGYFVSVVLMSGSISISTGSNNASITISSVPPLQSQSNDHGDTPAVTKKGTGSLTVRLHSGSYIVTVQNGGAQQSQLVKIGWLAHKAVTVKPAAETVTEPVLYESVQNVAVDSSRMIYLNNAFNGIEYINAQNQDVQISNNQYFTSVAWADPEYGIAQDKSGNLYVIDGDAAHALQSPISNQSNVTGAAYAIAPDRTIYIGLGSNLWRGTENHGFTPIYGGFTSSDTLEATNNNVTIINPNVGGSRNSGLATLISTKDKVINKYFGYPLSGWTPWSRNGSYMVVSEGNTTELYDASLKLVATLPQVVGTSGGAWLDDNTVFYYTGSQLWSYNFSQGLSNLIATMPGDKTIQSLSVSSDGSYVYATTSNGNDVYPRAVYRVGLHGQPVSNDLSTLEDVLPISGSTFSVGLRNFSGTPIIDVTTFPGSDTTDALQTAQDDVSGMINVSDFNFSVEAGD